MSLGKGLPPQLLAAIGMKKDNHQFFPQIWNDETQKPYLQAIKNEVVNMLLLI